MKPRRHRQIDLPPLDAGYALTLVDIFERALAAIWRPTAATWPSCSSFVLPGARRSPSMSSAPTCPTTTSSDAERDGAQNPF